MIGVDVIPIVGMGTGTLHDMVQMVKNGFNSTWGDFIAEGVVARPIIELKTGNDRVITKLKYTDFHPDFRGL